MNTSHVVPTQDVLKALRSLALACAKRPGCPSSRKPVPYSRRSRPSQRTLWIEASYREARSNRRQRCPIVSQHQLWKHTYSSAAIAETDHYSIDGEPPSLWSSREGEEPIKKQATPLEDSQEYMIIAQRQDQASGNISPYISASAFIKGKTVSQDTATAALHYLSMEDEVPYISQNPRCKIMSTGPSKARSRRQYYICNFFLHQVDSVGLRLTFQNLCKYLEIYIQTGKPDDLQVVTNLLRTWMQIFKDGLDRDQLLHMVRQLLSQEPLDLSVVKLLYDRGKALSDSTFRFAELYLVRFCQRNQLLQAQLAETFKILDGTKLCGIQPSEQLLRPIIADMMKRYNASKALDVLQTLMDKYKISPSVRLLNTIALECARNQDWSGFEWFLANMPRVSVGSGRYKPNTFNLLLRTGLREFARHHSPEEVFDFLNRQIQDHAIIPDKMLLRMILQTFLKAQRYDLVQKWVRWMKSRFPFIGATSSDATFAFELSMDWRNSHTSCVDILNSCLALAYGEVHDPFPAELRFVVEDLVATDLHNRYLQLIEASAQEGTKMSPTLAKNWRFLAFRALELCHTVKLRPENDRSKFLAKDLTEQVEAVRLLANLFAGRSATAAVARRPNDGSNNRDHKTRSFQEEQVSQHWPACIRNTHMPTNHQELASSVCNFYTNLADGKIEPSPKILLHVTSRLQTETGSVEAFRFLLRMYESAWRNKQTWTVSTYTKWLEVAAATSSTTAIRRVLWAIMDAPDHIKMNNSLSVLIGIASQRSLSDPEKSVTEHEKKETDYLVTRLRRKHWIQSGRPSAVDIKNSKFPNWSLVPVTVNIEPD